LRRIADGWGVVSGRKKPSPPSLVD
jgi:hypothetical protein